MILGWLAWLMVLPQNWWNLLTHAWLVHALKKAKTSRYLLLAVDPEAAPLQKPLGQRGDSERQDFPAQEHFFCPPFAFSCLACYPVRVVCCPPGALPGGALQQRAAGSSGSSKTLQGSASPPVSLEADVGHGCAAWPPLCTHFLCLFSAQPGLLLLIYEARLVLRCVWQAADL